MDTIESPLGSKRNNGAVVYLPATFARAPYPAGVELLSEPPADSFQATGSSSVSAADSGWTAIEHRFPSKPVSARLIRPVVLESLLARMSLDLDLFYWEMPILLLLSKFLVPSA